MFGNLVTQIWSVHYQYIFSETAEKPTKNMIQKMIMGNKDIDKPCFKNVRNQMQTHSDNKREVGVAIATISVGNVNGICHL